MSNEEFDFVKTKTKEAALSSYGFYNNNVPQYMSKEDSLLYQTSLKIKKNLIIQQKSDKGNSVVIVKRQDYLKKMNDILSDQKNFSKVRLKDDTLLNFTINQEKHVDKVLKNLLSL